MRVDAFSELDEKIISDAKKEIPESEYQFSKSQLNQFFSHPVWTEIEKLLKLRQAICLQLMLGEETSREEDLKRKGQFTELVFLRNIRSVLEPEEKDHDTK